MLIVGELVERSLSGGRARERETDVWIDRRRIDDPFVIGMSERAREVAL
jgi:hypothetical protein